MLAIVIYMVVAIMLWLAVANTEVKANTTSQDEMKGGMLVGLVILFSLLLAPVFLGKEKK